MSERSTGLFLPGHVPGHALAALLAEAPGLSPADLVGEEAPRVGHGARAGRPYTHLALRLFEVGGLALMEQERPPGPDELEVWLGARLSRSYGLALYAHYDDERGVGGHALFRDGALVSRAVIDGRMDRPVRRGLGAEEPLASVDPSDWVWPHIAEAVEAGTTALFGPGVRTDDDLAAIIQAAATSSRAPSRASWAGTEAAAMPFEPYRGDVYLNDAEVQAWCRALAEARPGWVTLTELGPTREGRPILLLTLGKNDGHQDERPGFWLDGGTHAAEWTGVMAALYAVSQWIQRVDEGDPSFTRWLTEHTITVMPNVSPDGYEALIRGEPYLRSTLRPPPEGAARAGLEPCDLDGDGATRWMRWRHPAGPFVQDEEVPLFMRPRRLSDRAEDAFFVASEGRLLNWDGARWTSAPARYGLDLNRNFPAHWAPFSMFGQDGGRYPLSEVESRVMVDAFAARPMLSAGLTNHTYTGALLTQPYRQDSPMKDGDVLLMETLAKEAVEGTGYRVIRVCPDFMYDPKKAIVGVWADTMSSVFGVPGYTLELWNPYGHCGVEVPRPAELFANPDPAVLKAMIRHFSAQPGATSPWRPFDHPQLGPVELGGLDYMRTVRNPPLVELPAECRRGFLVADRLRLALPRVEAQLTVTGDGPGPRLARLVLENLGALGSAGLQRAEEVGAAPPVSASLTLGPGLRLVHGAPEQAHAQLDGWCGPRGFGAAHPIYPSLPARGHRAVFEWWVEGAGVLTTRWRGGRGGLGAVTAQIS